MDTEKHMTSLPFQPGEFKPTILNRGCNDIYITQCTHISVAQAALRGLSSLRPSSSSWMRDIGSTAG